ncbi:hypothetical protein HK096_009793 [Nowakowskiella sp. JEL0078]|nr:hypothetical protein HK096_009793 [Nowakowskiella sp. JEL0078]
MVASTVLTVTASTLILNGRCDNDPMLNCKYSLARNVAIDTLQQRFGIDQDLLFKIAMDLDDQDLLRSQAMIMIYQSEHDTTGMPDKEYYTIVIQDLRHQAAMGSLADLQGPYSLFVFQYDILCIIILYVDGFKWKKKIPTSLILHWILRSIGGIISGITVYCTQNDNSHGGGFPGWKYFICLPSAGYYIGELFLDSYPFQKAVAAANGDRILKGVALAGFVPLFVMKFGMMGFRMSYPFLAPNYSEFLRLSTIMDSTTILVTAWSDALNCLVIVYIGLKTIRFSKNRFLRSVVRTTEMRMVATTCLAVASGIFTALEPCSTQTVPCIYTHSRNMATGVAYSLYYLDYFAIKFFDIFHDEVFVSETPAVSQAKISLDSKPVSVIVDLQLKTTNTTLDQKVNENFPSIISNRSHGDI